jgi:hypothetical protein
MGTNIKTAIDPRVPLGKTGYGFGMVVCVLIAQALIPWVNLAAQRTREGPSTTFALALALCDFIFLAVITAKRLTDVGWPRSMSAVVVGPLLAYAIMALGRFDTLLLKIALALVGLAFLAACVLLFILAFRPARSG